MLICPLLSSCEEALLSEGRRVGLFEKTLAFQLVEEQEYGCPIRFGGEFGII